MMAVDIGLGREGTRDPGAANRLAARIARDSRLELRGFYTHEGFFYAVPRDQQAGRIREMIDRICAVRDAIDRSLPVWPGCSVSAAMVALPATGSACYLLTLETG